MQNRIIIATFILLSILSFSFLAYTEEKNKNIDTQNIWFLYFNNLKDQSLNFSIENHTDNTKFHWEILADKNKIQEGTSIIEKDTTKKINPTNISNVANKKMLVHVTASDNSAKEIYKNF
jgi:hypothetical protein